MSLPSTLDSKLENVKHERTQSEGNIDHINRENKLIAYRIKQSRKGYIANLTKCINHASFLLKIPDKVKSLELIKEKIEIA